MSASSAPQLRQPYSVARLPWLARLHRNAFRSGRHDVWELTKFASRMAFYCGRSIWPFSVQGEFGVDVAGEMRHFRFDARNRMFSAVYFDKYSSGYEPPVLALVDALLPDDGVFFDIGSNWGYFSIYLASRPRFAGQIHAFEPWPTTYADLSSTVRQLGLDNVVHCHNFALGESNHEGAMQCGSHSGCAKLAPEGSQGVAVKIQALDELRLPRPDLMKVDTEGHEEHVFAGARSTLETHRPMLIFEHRYELFLDAKTQKRSLELLESLGYRLFLPSWNGSVENASDQRDEAAHQRGLRLTACTSETRFDYPEHPDLFACPQEKARLLETQGWIDQPLV